ncbi:hypothetical protein DIPPA_06911 [Diplonema papillatum]|nr:hypothetical protein DIPPA_06911 [Diplonema papillatum]
MHPNVKKVAVEEAQAEGAEARRRCGEWARDRARAEARGKVRFAEVVEAAEACGEPISVVLRQLHEEAEAHRRALSVAIDPNARESQWNDMLSGSPVLVCPLCKAHTVTLVSGSVACACGWTLHLGDTPLTSRGLCLKIANACRSHESSGCPAEPVFAMSSRVPLRRPVAAVPAAEAPAARLSAALASLAEQEGLSPGELASLQRAASAGAAASFVPPDAIDLAGDFLTLSCERCGFMCVVV